LQGEHHRMVMASNQVAPSFSSPQATSPVLR